MTHLLQLQACFIGALANTRHVWSIRDIIIVDRDVRNTGWLFLFLGSLVRSDGLPYLRAYHSERTTLGAP